MFLLLFLASPGQFPAGPCPWILADAVADLWVCLYLRLFGFFLGSSLAAGGVYYYAIQEYKASNELLTEDIYVRVCI
jgi:hypothetical protein